MSLRISQKVASKVNQCKKIVSPVLNQQQRFAAVNPVVQHHEKLRPSVQVDPLEPIQFPRQRPGLEYDLNWSLVPLQITPYHDSFRNASVDNLLKLSYGEVKDNALYFDAASSIDASSVQKLITFQPEELKTNWKIFAPKFHRRVQREVAYYLTHVPSSFVQDGDFGFGVKLRVITDNANAGLILKNLILSTRKLSAVDFKSDAMVFHAPGYQFTPANVVAEFSGPTPNDLGLTNDQFVMLNDQENRITIGGVQDLNVLIDSIVHVASKAALAKQSLIIPSDAILSKTGVTLIVNHDGDDVAQLRKNALAGVASKNYQLYSSHHNMLSKEGLSRVWNGSRVIVDSATFKKLKLNAGTVVESINDGKQYIITSKDSARPTVVKAPSSIVFMARDGTNSVPALGKISAETAKNLLLSGKASGFPELSADNVKQVFDQLTSNVQFYVINSSHDQKTIAQAVDSVATGSVKSAVDADSAVQSFLGGKK